MVIGEVAVNVIALEPRGVPVDVSVRVPETLYVPPGDTDDGDISRVIETLSFRVVATAGRISDTNTTNAEDRTKSVNTPAKNIVFNFILG